MWHGFLSNPATCAQLILRFVFAASAIAFVAVPRVCRDVLVKNFQRKRNLEEFVHQDSMLYPHTFSPDLHRH